ncbi:hypothetical protein [Actinopolymorpha pittospori]
MRRSGTRPGRSLRMVTASVAVAGLVAVIAPSGGQALATSVRASVPRTSALFAQPVDPYAPYVGQWLCDPTPKAGVVDVLNLVRAAYRPRWWGIAGTCASTSTSEHKEGRALDIAFDAGSPRERAAAEDFLRWLLAPDQDGNQHAMARRLGVMYVIWNHQIWRSYRPQDGWQPYTGTPNPHTDHIHLSFSWEGALRQTTWWTQGGAMAAGAGGTVDPAAAAGRVSTDGDR